MKLLHFTTRNFLISSLVILLLTGILLYFVIRTLVEKEMIEQLDLQADMIADELKEGRTIKYPLVDIQELQPGSNVRMRETGDSLIYDHVGKDYEDYKYLRVVKQAGTSAYRITVMLTYIGWNKYYQVIFTLLGGAGIVLVFAGVLFNYRLSRKLWAPFFFNLKQLKSYSLSRPEKVHFEDSAITEFSEMKISLVELTERSRREYLALREFTENASHEIQTPLGIVQSKLDRISQMQIDEEMAIYIVQAKAAVERLRKVNKGLLLLAKLENNAYADKEALELGTLVSQLFDQMEELFLSRGIKVTLYPLNVVITANRFLMEMLLSNLFANALHHTPQNGHFEVQAEATFLRFTNSGPALTFPAEQLFDRFKKGNQHSQSTGLGLSIVQQICFLNGWRITYQYETGRHIFTIHF